MADVKYKDFSPVDEPIPKGKIKAVEPGSGIRVDKTPKSMSVEDYDRMVNRPYKSKFNLADYSEPSVPKTSQSEGYTYTGEGASSKAGAGRGSVNPKRVDEMAKGGKVSASSRADGIAQRGKTKGTMIMCGGGYAKGKK
jgi:hypothetical protein